MNTRIICNNTLGQDLSLEPFWQAIEAAPLGDMMPMAIFADYLNEIGHPWAKAANWVRDEGKHPSHIYYTYHWWSAENGMRIKNCRVPFHITELKHCGAYSTLREAYEDLFETLTLR